MNMRLMVLSSVVTAFAAFAVNANAHDFTSVPTTCDQLADSHNYSNDVTNPDIKALKERCDADKRDANKPKAPAKPKATTKPAALKAR